ncbi:MAG: hypothetical protein ACRDPY_28035 [Streptosporangiaceae bacterium]
MLRIRGHIAACQRWLNGSMMNPVPADAIPRSSLASVIFRAASMEGVSRSRVPATMVITIYWQR